MIFFQGSDFFSFFSFTTRLEDEGALPDKKHRSPASRMRRCHSRDRMAPPIYSFFRFCLCTEFSFRAGPGRSFLFIRSAAGRAGPTSHTFPPQVVRGGDRRSAGGVKISFLNQHWSLQHRRVASPDQQVPPGSPSAKQPSTM